MDEPVVIAEAGMHFTPAAMDEPVVIAEAGMHYTPTDILWKFGSRMTPFEHDELTRYKHIYYFKIRQPSQSSFNDVHDFTSHDYNLVQDEHLAYRYQFLSVLGAGAYGQVIRCLDHKHKREVAVKMLQHESYAKPYHSKREVQMLKALQSKEKNNNYVIKLLNTFTFRGHFSLVLELLTGDLRQQLNLAPTAFTLPEAKVYVRSILKALQKLKNKKIIHGDLKPENILIKDQDTSDVRLADFGLSFQECPNFFKRFGTEQYTAPEMYLKLPITCSVDMWSLGCVAAELVTGHYLFNRKLQCHHLERVIEILGVPPMTVIVTSKAKLISFGHMGEIFVKNKKVIPESLPLNEVLGTENIHFLNFIKGCLTWDPMWRFTPEDALEHEWMADSSLYLDAEAFLTPSSQAEGTFFTPGNNCGTLSEIDDDSSSDGCGSPDPAASAPSPPASSESVESYVTACEWLREPSGGAIPSASGERGTEKGLREDSSWDGGISWTMSQGNWVPVPCTSKEHRRPDDGRDEDAAATIAAATTVPTIFTISTVTATTVPTISTISTIATATTVPTISTISTISTVTATTVPTISTISTVTATTVPTISTISTIATATTVPTISTISTISTVTATTVPTISTIATATTVPTISNISTISTITTTVPTISTIATATTVPTISTISTISTVTATTVPTISTISTATTVPTISTISTISTVTATTVPTISTIATATTVPTISTISTIATITATTVPTISTISTIATATTVPTISTISTIFTVTATTVPTVPTISTISTISTVTATTVPTISTISTIATATTVPTISTIATATTVPTISTISTISTVTATTVPTISTISTIPTVPTISTISTIATATTVPTISTISTIFTVTATTIPTVPTISTISTVTATTVPTISTISTIATATTVPTISTISTISTVTATTPTAPSTTTSVADDDDVGSGPTEARRTRRRFAGTRRRFRKFLSFVRNHCCCCTSGEDDDPVTGPAIRRPGDKV
ncbi:uncharacterized protein LOC142930410 [Petromyzon marinus]|uniref:uncharacterized protein LOC142930410 n=1 Tax=Petromyzon marinus TaxID=7757 RepID=UPI003F704B27